MDRRDLRAEADRAARVALALAGSEVKASRKRRRLTQRAGAALAGVSQSTWSRVEDGRTNVSVGQWFRVVHAAGRKLRFEIPRDPSAELTDAGHLSIQELVLRTARSAGYTRFFELPTRAADPWRSADVGLRVDRSRLLILLECWNTLRDLGAAARSTDRKLAEMGMLAATLGDGSGYTVRGCWVLRDTAANRALVDRYPEIFATRFPGSSRGWVAALTEGTAPPADQGLIWCDRGAKRLFARRGRASAS